MKERWNNLSAVEKVALIAASPFWLTLGVLVAPLVVIVFMIYSMEKFITGKDPEWD